MVRDLIRLIKDINFYTLPKSFSFRTDLDRMYNVTLLRNVNNSYMLIEPTYNKYFNWNKSYEFKYDLTRTLKVDFSAEIKQVLMNQKEEWIEIIYILKKIEILFGIISGRR